MPRQVRVHRIIAARIEQVWEELSDIGSHAEWMAEAERITFVGSQRSGEGTRITVPTRVGPFRTVDEIVFTAWEPPHRMAVRHSGLVTGEGEFTLSALDDATTRMEWDETLRLPLRFGGRAGERVAAPLLAAIWRRNLRTFAGRLGATSR
ncbi:MAG: SRPBCC family protein [Acidimicrobiia bacterium]